MDWLKYPSFNLSDSTKHAIYLQNKSDNFDGVQNRPGYKMKAI